MYSLFLTTALSVVHMPLQLIIKINSEALGLRLHLHTGYKPSTHTQSGE